MPPPNGNVSVFSGQGGGAPAAQPPRPPSPMLFKRDGFLSDSYIAPGTRLEDAIRVKAPIHHKKQKSTLDQYFKMLLSSIRIRWDREPGPDRLPKKKTRETEPFRKNEQARKREQASNKTQTTRSETKSKERIPLTAKLGTAVTHLIKKIEQKTASVFASIRKGLQAVIEPPYQAVIKGLETGSAFVTKVAQKAFIEPIFFLKEKLTPPLEKALSFISEKTELAFAKVVQTVEKVWVPVKKVASFIAEKIESATIAFGRETKRVVELAIAPVKEALETVQTVMNKLYTPLKKAREKLIKKLLALPKPGLPQNLLEKVSDVVVKPLKEVINTFIAAPLARTLHNITVQIQQSGQFLAKQGTFAAQAIIAFTRAIAASLGRRAEKALRRFARFLAWLWKILKAAAYRLLHALLKIPQQLAKSTHKLYLAFGRLTLWTASRFFRS